MAPPGRRKICTPAFLPLLFLLLLATSAHAASAVLGIDLGTEYLKAAIAKPGSPIEIVLSKDSKRKEAATLAFKPSRAQKNDVEAFPERLYGGDASALSSRFPADVYPNLKTLLGLESSADAVKTYSARYPGLSIESVAREDVIGQKAGTVGFKSQSIGTSNNEAFMAEELLAMELKNVKSNAEAMVAKGVFVTDVVITHPSFYTSEEKRAIELAADLAGLRVLGLVTDGLAVGINYATHRTFESVTDGAKPEYHLIYDMGAGSTTATVMKFQGRTIKGPSKRNSTFQEVIALGTGFDSTLGGDSLNDVIVEDILTQFIDTPKVKALGLTREQVQGHGKAMARIWKEAERIRQLLSANAASSATFEGLYNEDITFKYSMTRDRFEEVVADYASRVGTPIETALQAAGLQLSELDSIILHGGAVRTPFVQKQLEKVAGGSAEIKSNVNADEAAVMGAAFKAASLSPSFRVKDIRDVDISGSAYTLKWNTDSKAKAQKLFTPSSQVGIEKQVPFKALEDLSLVFSQVADSAEITILQVEASNLTKSVAELKDKHGCVPANISTIFTVRLSPVDALPEVVAGSVSCEINGTKTGSVMDNVKGLFGFGGKKDSDQKVITDDDVVEDDLDSQTPLPVSDPTSSGSTISSASPSPSGSSGASSSTTKSAKANQPTPSVISIPLALKATVVGRNAPPAKTLPRLRERLSQFDASDRNAALRAEALNTLEGFTYRARDYLEDKSFIAASSESARKELTKLLSSTTEWLYGEGTDAKLQDFKDKLKSLRALVDPVLSRKDESTKRPDAVKALKEGLENMNGMISMVEGNIKKAAEEAASKASDAATVATSSSSASPLSSMTEGDDLEDDPYNTASAAESLPTDDLPQSKPYEYTDDDQSALTTKYDEVKKWLDDKLALQDKLGPYDDPAFLAADLEAKSRELSKIVSDTIMKSVKMQDLPRKPKASGSKKAGAKGKGKKGKSANSGSSSGSSTGDGSATSTTTVSSAKPSKSTKDEL